MKSARHTNATTRTRSWVPSRQEDLLERRRSRERGIGLRFQISRLIGQGGFGQVFLAQQVGRSQTVPETVCIKVSRRIDGWLREAYFGQLLDDHPRAIRIYDTFVAQSADRTLYCLALEYAQQGDLSAYLKRTGKKWNETIARREIAGVLQVLGKLHRGQMLHRDLTPLNVFVCDGNKLKRLRHRPQQSTSAASPRARSSLMAPSDIFLGAARSGGRATMSTGWGGCWGCDRGDAESRVRAPECARCRAAII